ncbi:apolipoprotein N-acyltransferase [Sporohalobacter salinus]|uniref:apolipoprotein N-acyltransferase n=1 Tax=Sporohalobacter salinus TaxID=1494606 RepID=UPI0019616149|nr:apolipoprotein N-acyltransferase [Sporohalobacter salinus]MBM7624132.1 apolipoprotein N-acyltransferase [Sporohalobacter salinus]
MRKRSFLEFTAPILSGILMGIPFQFPRLYFVNWISLIPLLLIIKTQTPKKAFRSGIISGGIFFGIILYWLIYPQIIFNLPIILAFITVILLCSLLAVFTGVFSVTTNYILNNYYSWSILLIPASWTALEYLRVLATFNNLPFGIIGYSQAYFTLLVQIADLIGGYGVTFLIILINILIYKLVLYFKIGNMLTKKEVIISFLILVIIVSYGIVKLNNSSLNQTKRGLKLGIMQPNIPQNIKWNENYRTEIINKYLNLTKKISVNKKIDFIIWPETAVPFTLNNSQLQQKKIFQKIDNLNISLLTGVLNQVNDAVYNQVLLIDHNLGIINKYNKTKLVPFGEYICYRDYLPKFITKLINNKTPGTKLNNFNYKGVKWGIPICSEILNPNLVSKLAVNNHFLVNMSNEAWFKDSNELTQLWQISIFRAVENRKTVIKVSNTGISGIINDHGEIIKQITPFKAKVFTYNLKVKENQTATFYNKYGDSFIYIIMIIIIGFLLKERLLTI